MTNEELMQAALEELQSPAGARFCAPVMLGVQATLTLVAQLQLALRHPANVGPSRDIARGFIDHLIQEVESQGLPLNAQMLRLGDVPNHDVADGMSAITHHGRY